MLATKKQQIQDALLGSNECSDNRGDPVVDTGPPSRGTKSGYHETRSDPGSAFEGGGQN